jgi:hypothetical protein
MLGVVSLYLCVSGFIVRIILNANRYHVIRRGRAKKRGGERWPRPVPGLPQAVHHRERASRRLPRAHQSRRQTGRVRLRAALRPSRGPHREETADSPRGNDGAREPPGPGWALSAARHADTRCVEVTADRASSCYPAVPAGRSPVTFGIDRTGAMPYGGNTMGGLPGEELRLVREAREDGANPSRARRCNR